AGGLMSYGPNQRDLFRRAAEFVDKILRGAKPADIAVEQPTKFDLVVNLTTAKALGLTIARNVPVARRRSDRIMRILRCKIIWPTTVAPGQSRRFEHAVGAAA